MLLGKYMKGLMRSAQLNGLGTRSFHGEPFLSQKWRKTVVVASMSRVLQRSILVGNKNSCSLKLKFYAFLATHRDTFACAHVA